MSPPTTTVRAGQTWTDCERGQVRVIAVADGYAMLRRRRRNPFLASTDQMLAGQYGWQLIAEAASTVDEILDGVRQEIDRATAKFPTWPSDPLHASGVVQEESAELAKAVLQAVYEPHKSTPQDVAAEAYQTAAMAILIADAARLASDDG